MYGENVPTIEKILAEYTGGYGSVEVAVGGCEHPYINRNRPATPDPFELSLLKHPQESNLHLA